MGNCCAQCYRDGPPEEDDDHYYKAGKKKDEERKRRTLCAQCCKDGPEEEVYKIKGKKKMEKDVGEEEEGERDEEEIGKVDGKRRHQHYHYYHHHHYYSSTKGIMKKGTEEEGQATEMVVKQVGGRESPVDHQGAAAAADVDHERLEPGEDCLVLVKFYHSDGCHDCQCVSEVYKKLAPKHCDIIFLEADVGLNDCARKELGLENLPTFVAFRGRFEVGRVESAKMEDVEELINGAK